MEIKSNVKVDMSIFLVGYMGTGKTSASKLLADKLQMPLIDTDELIVAQQGMSISDIFAEHGEEHFRKLETDLVKSLVAGKAYVISCGGGLPLREENRRIIKEKGVAILLTATAETIYERVKNDNQRPLLINNMTVEHIATMLEQRKEAYEDVAQYIVATEGKTPEQVCDEILNLIY